MQTADDQVTIGVDLMGSDASPSFIANAFQVYYSQSHSNTQFRAYCNRQDILSIEKSLAGLSSIDKHKVKLVASDQTIDMSDQPLVALRQKKEASLVLGLKDLKEGCIDALISSGNTGAVVAGSALFLSRLEGVVRPALAVTIPLHNKSMVLLDVGGNVLFSGKDLVRHALLGIRYHSYLFPEKTIKVGLLNIGGEVFKGTEEHQEALKMMSKVNWSHFTKKPVEFFGNVEPDQVLFNDIDVLVTDGLNGNIFLKTLEGAMRYATCHLLDQDFPELDSRNYPGALVLGVNGLVIKCHGYGSVESIVASIDKACQLIQNAFHEHQKNGMPYTIESLS